MKGSTFLTILEGMFPIIYPFLENRNRILEYHN